MGHEPIPIGEGGVEEAFNRNKIEEEIGGFVEKLESRLNGRGPVAKTIPMRPEWAAEMDKLKLLEAEHKTLDRKHNAQHDFLWGMIKRDLDDFRDMRYNPKTNEVEIHDDKNA